MINISVVKDNEKILKIEAVGHSGYADYGKDIVCSAVSTILESLINGLTEVVKVDAKFKIDESKPNLTVEVDKDLPNEKMKEVQILMKTAYLALKSVASEYTKFIKIGEQND